MQSERLCSNGAPIENPSKGIPDGQETGNIIYRFFFEFDFFLI